MTFLFFNFFLGHTMCRRGRTSSSVESAILLACRSMRGEEGEGSEWPWRRRRKKRGLRRQRATTTEADEHDTTVRTKKTDRRVTQLQP